MTAIKLALPKGRMREGLFSLLRDAGVRVRVGPREYRPSISLPGFQVKLLKPQNIVEMLHAGTRDLGFAGHDWVQEKNADLVEVVDTGLDPVRLVAAAPIDQITDGKLPDRHLVVASEYERITRRWIKDNALDATFVRTYGATEVFPPDDADCIVDNTATGATIVANRLEIVDTLLRSSTRMYANPAAMKDPGKRDAIEHVAMLLKSVIAARARVMLELNVPADRLDEVIEVLPCMREPTVSQLHGESGYAVKAAVPRDILPMLIPELKSRGGSDIVVSSFTQIIP